jgi:hypothetical protein
MKRYQRRFEEVSNFKEANLPQKFNDKISININDINDLKKVIIRIIGTYYNDIKPFNYVIIEDESYEYGKIPFAGSTHYILSFIIKDSKYKGTFNVYTPTGFLNKNVKTYWLYITDGDIELNIEIKNKGDYK